MKHVLKDVKIDTHTASWSASCTCGKWAVAMAKTARVVRSEHKAHKRAMGKR